MQHSTLLAPRNDWMKDYQAKKIWQLVLPGTHDSATFRYHKQIEGTQYSQCQAQSIYKQLAGGVRSLDLRICMQNQTVWCSHNFQTIPFSEVLQDVKHFVGNNTQEIVLFQVKLDWEPADCERFGSKPEHNETVNLYIQSVLGNQTIDPKSALNMTLGEMSAQKKNIVLMRGWEKELDEYMTSSWTKTQDVNPEKVCSNCRSWAQNQTRSPNKILDVQTQITPDLSHLPGEVELLDRGLKSWAKWTNYILKSDLIKEIAPKVNVISMDWVNDQVIESIIESNEKIVAPKKLE